MSASFTAEELEILRPFSPRSSELVSDELVRAIRRAIEERKKNGRACKEGSLGLNGSC